MEIVLVGAALYLAVGMFAEVGWLNLRHELLRADLGLVGLTAALLVSRWVLWSWRWHAALQGAGIAASRARALFAILAGAALNHLTPSFRIFGGLVRARYLSESPGTRFQQAYGSVVFDQILNQTVMGSLSAIAFVTLSWHLGRRSQSLVGSLAILAILLLVPLLWRHLSRRGIVPSPQGDFDLMQRLGRRLRPLAEGGREVLTSVQHLLHRPGLLIRALLLSLAYAVSNLAAAWLSFAALGQPAPFLSVFFAVSLGVTIGAISGTPGGGLTTEAAMVTCYSLLGIDRTTALAATLLYRGLHYVLVVLLGVPSLVTLETLHRRRAAAAPAATTHTEPSEH